MARDNTKPWFQEISFNSNSCLLVTQDSSHETLCYRKQNFICFITQDLLTLWLTMLLLLFPSLISLDKYCLALYVCVWSLCPSPFPGNPWIRGLWTLLHEAIAQILWIFLFCMGWSQIYIKWSTFQDSPSNCSILQESYFLSVAQGLWSLHGSSFLTQFFEESRWPWSKTSYCVDVHLVKANSLNPIFTLC